MQQTGQREDSKNKCAICLNCDEETPRILYSLIDQMAFAYQKQLSRQQNSEEGKTEFIDFQRLLKIIFNKKYKNFKNTNTCPHFELKNQFITRLHCTPKELDVISDFIAWRISKFTYHLDTLSTQLKNFWKHFPDRIKSLAHSSSLEDFEESLMMKRKASEKKKARIQQKNLKLEEKMKGQFQRQISQPSFQEPPQNFNSNSGELMMNNLAENEQRNISVQGNPESRRNLTQNIFIPTFPSLGHLNQYHPNPSFFQPMNFSWSFLYQNMSKPEPEDGRNQQADNGDQKEDLEKKQKDS